ncbi:cytochrome P450 [Dendryphion nanum]|uniref:Cytochrome P450 n=1 Tax=Dendryphion nanum TaxID=256645 RepID=A0A9P9E8F8_9PLEO|nr:cytochrome P450 [Dendryphion nanum]
MSVLKLGSLGVVLVISSLLLRKIFALKRNSQEPPCVSAPLPIPFVGHVLGLLWQRTAYYSNLSRNWRKYPIFSINMFGGKVHIVGSSELMSSLQKQPHAISFWFMEALFTTLLGGMSQRSSSNLQANLSPGSHDSSLLLEGLKVTQQAMSPRGGLEAMIRTAADVILAGLDALSYTNNRKNIDLWAWTQHEITIATTEAVYGPSNPYRDNEVEKGFWNFADDSIPLLLTSYLPEIVAAKALAGRAVVVKAMERYFTTGDYKNGSSLVNARYHALKGNIDDDDLARFECVNGIAILANSVPTAFWMIWHVFSDAKVLAEVRRQVATITATDNSKIGELRTIDLSRLNEAPILYSAMQEALRLRATGTGPRMVLQDTFLDAGGERYLLKKDSVVIIANEAVHHDRAAWGDTADVFKADRFCEKVPGQSFRGFGGGVNLCPGRSFAMLEVAALVAMVAARFDMTPTGGGKWDEPNQNMSNMSLQIAPPKKQVRVDLQLRREMEGVNWRFVYRGSTTA